jgi:hypothetical protein
MTACDVVTLTLNLIATEIGACVVDVILFLQGTVLAKLLPRYVQEKVTSLSLVKVTGSILQELQTETLGPRLLLINLIKTFNNIQRLSQIT